MNLKAMGVALISVSLVSACTFPSGYRSMNQLTYGEPVRKVATVKASPSTPYRYATIPSTRYRLATKPTHPTTAYAGPVIADPTRKASVDNPVILGSNSRPAQAQVPVQTQAVAQQTATNNQVVYQAMKPNSPTVVSSTQPTPYAVAQQAYAQPVVTLKLPAPIE